MFASKEVHARPGIGHEKRAVGDEMDLFQMVSQLVDRNVLTTQDMTELMGSSYRPRYTDLLDVLVERGVLEEADREELKRRDAQVLQDHLRLKGVLE